jgi:hypothetical protein
MGNESVDIASSLSRLRSIIDMQHVCDAECTFKPSRKKVENTTVEMETVVYSQNPFFVNISFLY